MLTRVETERLIMRRWREEDREPFAAMNADPEVMEHFPAPLTREQSDAMIDRIERAFDEQGYGLWALEEKATGRFIGFTGLVWQRFEAPFTPALEVGWRLARHAWGRGYATEAGRRAIEEGFARTEVDEIVSITAVGNVRSRAVMERLGLTRDPADDFDHPLIPEGHPLRPHVLYRIRRP
ncbi:Protein N-acetyltransferase, RimJ/RimL family [Thermostaphylospora chromogena]|uniref:Protein N-acetyltransferase, RimJ/RimL family n=1 Tax=Thermostaphylospora chromogena TaxID=35622 RepID=A0A1H0ZYB6_9ACTN|nr:Protein N-acetyltransferase, RimJ/RimL family [Thermostaphylospora chromogena]